MKITKTILLLFIFLLFSVEAKAQISTTDWSTRARDASRSAFVPYDLPLDNTGGAPHLNLKWKRFFGERIEVEMEPLVVGNTVYIGIMNGKLYALDKDTGTTKWIYQAGGPLTDTPTLAYVNGNLRIFFGSIDGKVYSLDANSSQKVWDYQTKAAVMSTPSFYNNTIFIGSTDRTFYALDAQDNSSQRVKWSYTTNSPISNTSALGEITPGSGQMGVYFANSDNDAYGFDVNGTKLWEQKMSGVYTKRTMAVYGNGVVIFVTRKPGQEYSQVLENIPSVLCASWEPGCPGPQPGDVVINAWADYYTTYPQRRPLYYFNAATGKDLWQPAVDKTKYAPLYIPYWGEYSPLVDSQGYAWLPASGGDGDRALGHDMRLWKINLTTGDYTHVAYENQFTLRPDEVGRATLIGNKYYQTISEDVGYYDIAANTTNGGVFGNGFGNHRTPLEFAEYPGTTIFGGMHKHFGRFGSSGPGAFGGGNDAMSLLVVAGNSAFVTAWGHLYALTSTPVANPIKNYLPLDLVATPSSSLTKAQVKTMLNDQLQKIVTANTHINPASRFWSWGWTGGARYHFWQEGEVVRSLAEAIPYVDEPLKTNLKQYLKNEVQNYLLNISEYQYSSRCLDPTTKQVVSTSGMIGAACWYGTNNNLMAEKLYAFYKYAEMTGDWRLINDNWNFIKARYTQMKSEGNQPSDPVGFDAGIGFFTFAGWLAGNFYPHLQMGAVFGVREMAKNAGDTAIQTEADNYLTQMLAKRVTWGKYIRSLYDLPDTDPKKLRRNNCDNYNDWGYDGMACGAPMPAEGYLDKDSDYRQVYFVDRDTSGNLITIFYDQRDVAYYRMNGYHPFYSEFNNLVAQNLLDEVSDYVRATEIMNPWWYMGDMGHQVVNIAEEDSLSPVLASDVFQAKAYVLGESFENLRGMLPWTFENYDYKDIYRLQNLVALLQSPSGSPQGDVNNDGSVDVLDIQACVNHILGIQDWGNRADVNQDGSVNVLDVQVIVNIILGVGG